MFVWTDECKCCFDFNDYGFTGIKLSNINKNLMSKRNYSHILFRITYEMVLLNV